MTPTQELRQLIEEWGQRLEDLGPKLLAMRDDPESLTKEEQIAILEEAEVVFAAWHNIQFALNLQTPTNTIQ